MPLVSMKSGLFHFVTISFFGLAHGSVAGGKSRVPCLAEKQVAVRGGGGALGIDPQIAGEIFSAAYLTEDTFTLALMPQAEMYGMDKTDSSVVQYVVELNRSE